MLLGGKDVTLRVIIYIFGKSYFAVNASIAKTKSLSFTLKIVCYDHSIFYQSYW